MDINQNLARLVINGRTASQEDVNAGRCVFFIPDNRSEPYQFDRPLPIPAKLTTDQEPDFPALGTPIMIVQAEVVDGENVLLGFVTEPAEEGVCYLEEVELS